MELPLHAQDGQIGNEQGGHTAVADGSGLLLLERVPHDGADIAVVRLNRPEQRNPVDKDTITALSMTLDALTDPAAASVPDAIVITGAGTAFSSGGDLKGYQTLYRDPARFRRFMDDFDHVCHTLATCRPLTLAMINGTCVAGGLEIALACDLITISTTARIGDGHLRYAQLPGAGGSQRLVRAIGVQQAKRWLLTAELFDAQTAHDIGLTTLIAPPDQLEHHTYGLAAHAARHTPHGRERMKELLHIAQTTTLREGLRQEMNLVHHYAIHSQDATEGLDAFAQRRAPHYRGR